MGDTTEANSISIQFSYKEALLSCIYDEIPNRMRIICPVIKKAALEEKHVSHSLAPNFHSVLDVKYA